MAVLAEAAGALLLALEGALLFAGEDGALLLLLALPLTRAAGVGAGAVELANTAWPACERTPAVEPLTRAPTDF